MTAKEEDRIKGTELFVHNELNTMTAKTILEPTIRDCVDCLYKVACIKVRKRELADQKAKINDIILKRLKCARGGALVECNKGFYCWACSSRIKILRDMKKQFEELK